MSGRVRVARGWRDETGSAVVEFLGVSLLLFIPLVYLVLVLARVQAAGFAVEGAARDAARAYTEADDVASAAARAQAALGLAAADQGFTADDARLEVECSRAGCLAPGGEVAVRVSIVVSLPGAPSGPGAGIDLDIPVTATHTAVVDPLRAVP